MRKRRSLDEQVVNLVKQERRFRGPTFEGLTVEQWHETLEYFNHRCAYCGGPVEIIEHYLGRHGTTVSNCVPACRSCNVRKDTHFHDLSFRQNEKVLEFFKSHGVTMRFHIHNYRLTREIYWSMYCEECGRRSLLLGDLTFKEAQAYIEEYEQNKGYAYRE